MKSVCLRGEIHLLTRLLASCQLRNFPREFTEKCFAVFDQSSHAIYLAWYWPLLFFWEFFSIIPFMVWLQDSSQIKGRGYIFMSSIVCWRLAEVIFFQLKAKYPAFHFLDLDGTILPPVWHSNLGSDLSIDNIIGLGSAYTNSVAKMLSRRC